LRTPRPDFDVPQGIKMVAMDLKTGRRGVGPCGRVIEEAFIAGQEPDKDCSGATVSVSKAPVLSAEAVYQPKESEPTQAVPDAAAQSGESADRRRPTFPPRLRRRARRSRRGHPVRMLGRWNVWDV